MNTPAQRAPSINHTPLPGVGKIIAVASGKGGVGKSTVTVNLAHALTQGGKTVGILDADIYGPSIPRMLGLDTYVKPEIVDNLMVPPMAHGIRAMSMALITCDQAAVLRAPMITKALVQFLRSTAWRCDILLIDLPPGTGDVTLSLAQNAPLDGVIVVTTPQDIAVIDADKCAEAFTKLNVPIVGVVENMTHFVGVDGKAVALFGEGGGKRLAEKYRTEVLARIPLDPAIGKAGDAGADYVSQHKEAPASVAFGEIVKSL